MQNLFKPLICYQSSVCYLFTFLLIDTALAFYDTCDVALFLYMWHCIYC